MHVTEGPTWLTGSSSRTRSSCRRTRASASCRVPTCWSRATGSRPSARISPWTTPRSSTPPNDIVIPGFIDTHRHTWETSIRTCAPDYTLGAYFGAILDQFAPKYRPQDVLAANRWGALECLNAGITTLVDWSHIMNTADHADAAIEGLQDTGIRSVFAFGFPNTSIQTWWFGPDWTGSVERIDGDLAHRVRQRSVGRRRPDHDGPRDPGNQLLQARGRALRVGAREGARDQHHGPRRDGPLRAHEGPADGAPGHGPAVPRTRPTSTARTSPTRSGCSSATAAATSRSRPRSSSRWATAGRRHRRPTSWASRSA